MSLLFGTLSENDIENINRNVRTLVTNQIQIVHDLDVSLSYRVRTMYNDVRITWTVLFIVAWRYGSYDEHE